MSSVIIIGKGTSVSRCTKEFVDSHDEVALINMIIYNNYEHLVSNHADYFYGNRTSFRYDVNMVKKLGLKEMIFTGKNNQRFDKINETLKISYPGLRDEIIKKHNLDVSSGMQAFYHLLSKGEYTKISIVGFDFYEIGTKPYYFEPSEVQPELGYLWRGGSYSGDKISEPSGHDTDKSIALLLQWVSENEHIEFEMITNNSVLNKASLKNLRIWEE